jgi:hypothetical protein
MLSQDEIKNLITDLVKNSIQSELTKIRSSKGYDGRQKPISGMGFPSLNNRVNTGLLYNSVDVYYETDLKDGELNLVVDFGQADYWYWVNYGRKGKLQGAKYPPLSAIFNWARQRGLPQFRDRQGRFISNDDRAFLLQRSIGEYGIYKTQFVDKGIEKVLEDVVFYLGDYASEFITKLLEDKRIIVKGKTADVALLRR